MKRFFISAVFLILLLGFTPSFCQEDDDSGKFAKPQIDVLDTEEVIVESGEQIDAAEIDEVITTSTEEPNKETESQEKKGTVEKKEIPEETEKAREESGAQTSERKPVLSTPRKESSETVQENNNKQPQTPPVTEQTAQKPAEEAVQNGRNQESSRLPQTAQPQQKPVNTGAQQQIPEQRDRQQSGKPGQPTSQGNSYGNTQGNPSQPRQVPQQNQQVPQQNQNIPQQNQGVNQGQEPEQRRNIPIPEQKVYQEAAPSDNRDTSHRNIEIGRQSDSSRQKQQDNRYDPNEEDYLKLIGGNSLELLDHYKVYSESIYNYIEGLFREAVIPLYKQIRANHYLSMGLSAAVCLYVLIYLTRMLGSIFKRKPKFRYNKEETISQSDINNNFKRFLTELENIKKQISTTSATKGNDVGGSGFSNATIPQALQDNISFIAQGLNKNEDIINKMIKDKNKLDNFLMEFQKEVVESHKAIWNELYQLRKVFSQTRVSSSISGSLKPRPEASREIDDTKSLSSEMSEKKREEPRPVPNNKLSGEPRSKSVTPAEPGTLRRQPLPKDKRPAEVDAERRPSFPHPVNGQESSTNLQKEEEPKPKIQTPVMEKGSTQSPFQFGKPTKEEEEPGIQIPANLTDKAPSHNPFAQSGPTVNQTNSAQTGTPGLNVTPKTIPFGNPRAKPIAKPGIPGANIPGQAITNQTTSSNEGLKAEKPAERKTSLEIKNTPFQVSANHIQNPVEQPTTEKFEETKTDFESEKLKEVEKEGQEENQTAADDLDSESTSTSKQFVPPVRTGPGTGPLRPGPGKPGPVIPGNKGLPVPQVRRTGPPGATVFRGPPGNLPKVGGPTQIKQPSGPIIDGAPKSNTQV